MKYHTLNSCESFGHASLHITCIHPIHRFTSSDWIKEGHMTWIIFDNVHVWKLIHVLFFTISLTLEEAVTAAEFGTQ